MRKRIIILCAIVCLLGISGFVINQMQKEKNGEIYKEIQGQNGVGNDEVDIQKVIANPIDFASLKAINNDIYAWIDIEDTNIHYPIVQSKTDDSYYLEHTIEGVRGLPGSIYTEKVNAKDFSDFNTLIYGHDMKDGSMFKHLHKFKDSEFFNTHDTVVIYTEKEMHTYQIYAVVIYDDRHIMYHYDNDDMEDREAFIQSLKEVGERGSLYRKDVTIDTDSKLITMSTCITGQSNKRLLVVAVEMDVKQMTEFSNTIGHQN